MVVACFKKPNTTRPRQNTCCLMWNKVCLLCHTQKHMP